MGMDNDSGSGAAWGGAGLALGIGLIEGQIDERRHQEVLRALNVTRSSEAYIADLHNANIEAEVLLLQTRFRADRKTEQISRLNTIVTHYKAVDASRLEAITSLRDTLVRYDASTQRLLAQKSQLVAAQDLLVAKKNKIIELLTKSVDDTREVLAASAEQISLLKTDVATLENLVDIHSKRADRLTKLFDDAQKSGRRWKNQFEAIREERDEYRERLVRVGRGETLKDPTAPTTMPR